MTQSSLSILALAMLSAACFPSPRGGLPPTVGPVQYTSLRFDSARTITLLPFTQAPPSTWRMLDHVVAIGGAVSETRGDTLLLRATYVVRRDSTPGAREGRTIVVRSNQSSLLPSSALIVYDAGVQWEPYHYPTPTSVKLARVTVAAIPILLYARLIYVVYRPR